VNADRQDPSGPTLAQLGEAGVLRRILPLLPVGSGVFVGPGDDAAVLTAPDGRVVASTDVMVEGRDFRRSWSSAEDVGAKAAAQNLADIAAMGAVPTALLVALVAPPHTPAAWAEGLARGLAQGCAASGAGVVGGDLSAGSELVVTVTVLGDLQGRPPVLRSGARPGDVVAVAGVLGRSAAGWALLRDGRKDLAPDLVRAHLRPDPPLACGPAAARAGATAMLDVSDGLLRDLARIAQASEVVVDVHAGSGALAEAGRDLEPFAAACGDVRSASAWVLTGGEDHCLVACFPPGTGLPTGFEPIGVCLPRGSGDARVLVDGAEHAGPPGWDHFEP